MHTECIRPIRNRSQCSTNWRYEQGERPSALGQTGAISNVRFGSLADICSAQADVRFVPIADIASFIDRIFDLDHGKQPEVLLRERQPGGVGGGSRLIVLADLSSATDCPFAAYVLARPDIRELNIAAR